MSILSDIRSRAQVRSHGPFRKFTDQQLRQCADDGLTQAAAMERLGVTSSSTMRLHADRIGVKFKRKSTRRQFTAEEDDLIRLCAKGDVGLNALSKNLHASFQVIRTRAANLGVSIPVKTLPLTARKDHALPEHFPEYRISVGDDLLLARLRCEFGRPRDEVYPGVKVKAA